MRLMTLTLKFKNSFVLNTIQTFVGGDVKVRYRE